LTSNAIEVKSIAVIGAGMMGRAIAYSAALSGYEVVLEDVSRGRLQEAIVWIRQMLEEALRQGKIAGSTRDAALKNLSTATTVEEALPKADLILETLPEEMEMKIELFTIFDKFAKSAAILASSTASLSITALAEVTFCAERCIGMRLSAPGQESSVLELVRGKETSDAAVAACTEVGRRMGKQVVVVHEPGREAFAGVSG